ncbi:MAG: hypothetical protein JO324_03465 [Candidatus Eremiobacteraeota bacterium]|nr:hypothetical protein [Candidatus Eremiobacteraeota bacterium]
MARRFVTRLPVLAAAAAFAAFVCVAGIPTLRHDWNWPIGRSAIPTFLEASIGGWVPTGFGQFNAHPTTFPIALPVALAMSLFGPFAALVLFALAVGYVCASAAATMARRWSTSVAAQIGTIAFALFNPWVYNEVVAGHLIMVLAYGATIGLISEMSLGCNARAARCAWWLILAQTQLQFLIVALAAALFFALRTRKWLVPVAGAVMALPSAIGVLAERSTLAKTPYTLAWQENQSVSPVALTALRGYFPGYADHLGILAAVATWVLLALAIIGVVAFRRSRSTIVAAVAAVALFAIVTGVYGPFGALYSWAVRNVPASGVFRELYDLAGIFAALLLFGAAAATAAVRPLRYAALVAGILLPLLWLANPPSAFWIGSDAYPHPDISAAPFERVALLPAFQPLQLRGGGGDGADPDAHTYPYAVAALNEYLPGYPVDMALAAYEQNGDIAALRALGVSEIIARPWLLSRTNGAIGLAAASLAPPERSIESEVIRYVNDPATMIARCAGTRVVALPEAIGSCAVFFGDAPSARANVTPLTPYGDSIDPRTGWIDARFAFAAVPQLAQGIGGVMTVSTVPYRLPSAGAVLAFARGTLRDSRDVTLLRSRSGEFRWLTPTSSDVRCFGVCELVAQTPALPDLPSSAAPVAAAPVSFRSLTPWMYLVEAASAGDGVLRLNQRYDPGWIAVAAGRVLPHVRVDLASNGWELASAQSSTIVLLHATSVAQMLAELAGVALALWLLKAALREPTNREAQ